MAYNAVLSLNQNLEQISNPPLEQHQTPLQDQQIKSLQEKLSFLLDFLDDSWQIRSEEVRCLEREIRDAVNKAEDMVESHISKNFGQEGFQERQMRDQNFCVDFEIVADEIDSIETKAAKLKESWGATVVHQSQRSTSLPTGQSRLPSIGKNDMVGFHNDLNQIIDRLTGHQGTLQVIPVTGMGGIGKTTLARNVYNDPRIKDHFHICAWVSISQEYREREVLLNLLDSMKQLSAEMRQENNTAKLKDYLHKSLRGMMYLVVLDDIWTTEAWSSLRRIFPDDRNGSGIVLTTRLLSVVDSHRPAHHMQFLNKTDSWKLLRQRVFGEDCCPPELEEAGKEIAENCKGLPLSLVVIGGHLSNANRTKDHWEYVAQNVKSVVNSTDANCTEILSLSYNYLPHYLKACFLYMGVFPEDDEIRVSKLIKLWVAEGFLKPVTGKTLEEVAVEYLGDLISRNLIMISKKSSRGKIKTCGIHDMLRDLCLKKAQDEKLFHVRDKDNIFAESIKYSRRLCVRPDILHGEFKYYQSMGSLPSVRSILISFSEGDLIFPVDLDKSQITELVNGKLFPLLRVLDLKQQVQGFPFGEIKLVHSRYLAFPCHGKVSMPKTLPDFLGYLQTLIVDSDDVHLPEEIWRMTQLRHLLFRKCYLPCPTRSPIAGENFVLGNLLTLSKVSSPSCTKEVFERVPNLKKLGLYSGYFDENPLGILVNLPQLENLNIRGLERFRAPINFTFPANIKKLTLESCKIAWKHMTIVGSMPNLEVLKLLDSVTWSPEWELPEGEFCKLKFLLLETKFLEHWRANNTNFTCLECLKLRGCSKLMEIPPSFKDIQTLQIIDLDDASPSAVISAELIQEEQENFGNDIQVRVKRQFNLPENKELEAELIAKLESNDDELQISACSQLRWLIIEIKPPSKGLISRFVPRLLEFLDRDDHPQLQLEAAETMEKISIGPVDNINILIEQGTIPIMVNFLSSPKDELRERAIEVLGKIASESAKYRHLVLSSGVLTPLLAQFNDKTKQYIMAVATRTLSILLIRKPPFEQVKSAIRPLAHLILENDGAVLWHACEALFCLTFGKTDIKQAVIDAGLFPRLVELLLHCKSEIWSSVLHIVDYIILYADDTQTQLIIDNGVLPRLCKVLTLNYPDSYKTDTCYIISKIIGRNKDHIQAVIEAGIISPLLPLLQEAEIFNAAAEVIYNATTKGTNEQIKFLVNEGCIEPMCDLLVNPNEQHVIKICLEGLENILKVGEAEKNQGHPEDVNVFAQMIDDAGGLQFIKNLQTHDDSEICEEAVKILETYWQEEDD
ncbi:putative late blight resistance protein homolog R1A-3 isoform X2 [Olea europaea var. sylvestris]|uniref:putative late blight resistance protein homolog R1A-3 isoform X2 n=1 Tax=Olea europaea var. sylvestris TaxID=158386 RepID=UPI000C1D8402|nr:putative late blight resistance protein homolog R1A-3 isoform X2 [Olea europaea var. sylvestris]